MLIDSKNRNKVNNEPDWQGSGSELLGAIQIIKDKVISGGFLEIGFSYEFNDVSRYPIVIEIKGSGSVVESVAIAFKIDNKMNATQKTIGKKFNASAAFNAFKRNDFINYFADTVEKQSNFAFYINKTPAKFKNLKFHKLMDKQKIVFNEHLVTAILKVLDERKRLE